MKINVIHILLAILLCASCKKNNNDIGEIKEIGEEKYYGNYTYTHTWFAASGTYTDSGQRYETVTVRHLTNISEDFGDKLMFTYFSIYSIDSIEFSFERENEDSIIYENTYSQWGAWGAASLIKFPKNDKLIFEYSTVTGGGSSDQKFIGYIQ